MIRFQVDTLDNKTRILMCAYPADDRGPGASYKNHKRAIQESENIHLDEVNNIEATLENISSYDVFWFYIRFDPQVYLELKKHFPEKTFWFGPNVLLEKGEQGPSDEWENWFVENVEGDIYCNNSKYYMDHVTSFFKRENCNVVVPYCIEVDDFATTKLEKDIDCLVYRKRRRNDNFYPYLEDELLEMLEGSNLNVDSVIYGNHERKEYIEKLRRSKCVAWLSIEDYCSAAQLEAMAHDCVIIGTPYNLTHTFSDISYVDAQTFSSEEWIKWKDTAAKSYFDRITEVCKNYNEHIGAPKKYIIDNHSYTAYSDRIISILMKL